jgi:type II secretory pathway pseudopilin PulG
MTRRPGMSLTEVLVALFILTIGVIGILTMFPLGAAQMARAVRDDRSALAAANADSFMRWYWQNFVVPQQNPPLTQVQDTFFQPPNGPTQFAGGLFDNPALLAQAPFNVTTVAWPPQLVQFNMNQPNQINYNPGLMSYPVVVDPMGWQARHYTFGDSTQFTSIPRCSLAMIGGQPNVIGGQPNPFIPPIASSPILQQLFAFRCCSLTDSLGYYDNGYPNEDLEMRYNWLYVLQRPQFVNEVTDWGINGVINGIAGPQNNTNQTGIYQNANRNLYTANMTVVVFDRRSLGYPPPTVPGFEVVLPASFTSGLTSVTLTMNSADQASDLKPGSWVMDATINPNAVPFPIRQAVFYRVVSVTQVPGTANVNLELQTPVSPPTGYPPLGFQWNGTLVALKGVSGVFIRPQLSWN